MLVIKWMFYLEIKTTSYPINVQYLQKIQTFEGHKWAFIGCSGCEWKAKKYPSNITSPAKYRCECILLSIVFSMIFIKERKPELYLQWEKERERREWVRESNLRKWDTSCSNKFILKLTLQQEIRCIISRKCEVMNNIKNWKVQALQPTFPVTLNVQCFNKEATEINELLETEAHNISSDKPYI